MTVTFSVHGEHSDVEQPDSYVNVSNTRARELLDWLGFSAEARDPALCGTLPSGELAARCRRRLWPIARNQDPGTATTIEGPIARLQEIGADAENASHEGPTVVICGRPEGYLPVRTAQLLALCERAGAGGAIDFG